MTKAQSWPVFSIGVLFGLLVALAVSLGLNLAILKKVEYLEAEKRIFMELYGNQIIDLPLLDGEKELLDKAIKNLE
jgi:hypothetical protein